MQDLTLIMSRIRGIEIGGYQWAKCDCLWGARLGGLGKDGLGAHCFVFSPLELIHSFTWQVFVVYQKTCQAQEWNRRSGDTEYFLPWQGQNLKCQNFQSPDTHTRWCLLVLWGARGWDSQGGRCLSYLSPPVGWLGKVPGFLWKWLVVLELRTDVSWSSRHGERTGTTHWEQEWEKPSGLIQQISAFQAWLHLRITENHLGKETMPRYSPFSTTD